MGEVLRSRASRLSEFVASDARKEKIFKEAFQSPEQWNTFFAKHLHNGSPADQLSAAKEDWSPQSFQALFCAAWAHHPTEKGSYMIKLTAEQEQAVEAAFKEHCTPRLSSHLDGKGGSAAENYRFLKGYKELLVQMPKLGDDRYLFLKTEGHKLDLQGFAGHTLSWVKKTMTGSGMTASSELHALAKEDADFIEPRAAENYSKDYDGLLQELGLSGKLTTVHEMASKLLARLLPENDVSVSTLNNNALGAVLEGALAEAREHPFLQNDKYVKELQDLAKRLLSDNEDQTGRIFHEVIATPMQLNTAAGQFAPGSNAAVHNAAVEA
ncbi:hypothetical protein [Eleftheria terrae]|uniref:hypothetical protein n=1 Tax=Eleftheria terrae TaxID=1597781 RepID=UPI00263B7D37|nr:hypothetical protein [Eleftheria terrae]WKB55651.1 hypothetical protein N7L95_26635 [Eleftheria terrae]